MFRAKFLPECLVSRKLVNTPVSVAKSNDVLNKAVSQSTFWLEGL